VSESNVLTSAAELCSQVAAEYSSLTLIKDEEPNATRDGMIEIGRSCGLPG
jgi:hypothetical protein